jgi:WD40 repeat protein
MFVESVAVRIILLNNHSFATGHSDGIIRIWDIKTKAQLQQLTGHKYVLTVLVLINDDLLASSDWNSTINLWNYTNGILIKRFYFENPILDIVLFNVENLIFCCDNEIHIWNLIIEDTVKILKGHEARIHCLTLVSAPDLLASGSLDNTIRVWNLTTGRQTLTFHADRVKCLLLLENQSQLLASGEFDHLIKFWSLKQQTGSITRLFGHTGAVTALVSLKQSHMASSSADMTIKIWNYEKYVEYGATLLATLRSHSNQVVSLLVLPNDLLASASYDKTVKMWNVTAIYNYPNRANLIASVDD